MNRLSALLLLPLLSGCALFPAPERQLGIAPMQLALALPAAFAAPTGQCNARMVMPASMNTYLMNCATISHYGEQGHNDLYSEIYSTQELIQDLAVLDAVSEEITVLDQLTELSIVNF